MKSWVNVLLEHVVRLLRGVWPFASLLLVYKELF